MMKVYVLTILKNDILDNCEVFEDVRLALRSAKDSCAYMNVPVKSDYLDFPYDPKVAGWVIADDCGYFVSVVEREVLASEKLISNSYANMLDQIAGRPIYNYPYNPNNNFYINYPYLSPPVSKYSYPDIFTRIDAGKIPGAPPAPPPLPEPRVTGDDGSDPYLPGGFNYKNQPLLMQDIIDGPGEVVNTFSLNESQKWALVVARVRQRPNMVFTNDKISSNQKQILEDLKVKNARGLQIRDFELKDLQKMYDQAYEDANSSSEDVDDDSSSY